MNKQICGNYATCTHGKLPRDFKFICLTHRKGYQLVSRPLLGPHRRCTRVRLRCRWPHQLYINFVMCRDYSSPGRMGSTSTTPCAATTRLPVARALPQPCHAPSRRSISRRLVALALAVRPVTASRGATTRRPDCTGSTAPIHGHGLVQPNGSSNRPTNATLLGSSKNPPCPLGSRDSNPRVEGFDRAPPTPLPSLPARRRPRRLLLEPHRPPPPRRRPRSSAPAL
jgi:hypothetical protein